MKHSADTARPAPAVAALHRGIEGIALLMACLSPWAFGAVHPVFELLLLAGLAVMLLLWGACWVLDGRLTWQRCPVALCLAGLVLFGALQVIPWPGDWLARFAPATARWRERLLPAEPEQLATGTAELPGAAVSLYPTATRRAVAHLLVVFLLFAAVRNTYASSASLRRLAVFAAANGVLLAVFALAHSFTAAPHRVYWTYRTYGEPFGPFITRNHFPFYVNQCACLVLGLWFAWRTPHGRDAADDVWAPDFWGFTALVLMLGSVLFSLSRGGLVAFLAGAGFCLVVRATRASRRAGVVLLAAGLLATGGLLLWLSNATVRARVATLWEGTALEDSRVPLWERSLPGLRDFYPFGSGYGTFSLIEPLGRNPGDDEREVLHFTYEFAHNDYLEALLEGGVVRLALSLLAIFWVYRMGARAYRRYRHRSAQGLVLGALAAFTTAVVHGAGDFGLHVPAVAVLTAVIAAHLAALGGPRDARTGAAEAFRWRLGGLAPLAGLAVLGFLAFRLVGEEWGLVQADRYRLAADLRTLGKPVSAEDRRQQLEYLQAAVAFQPGDALLHTLLADAHLLALEEEIWRPTAPFRRTFPARTVLALAPGPPGFPPLEPLAEFGTEPLVEPLVMHKLSRIADPDLERAHLEPALDHYVRARDLCPLQARAQAAIGGLCAKARRAEPRLAYLERAALLRPADAEIAYLLGAEQFGLGRPDEAYASWRRCLSATDKHLPEVLRACAGKVSAETLAGEILPDRVDSLVRTALQLYSGPEGQAQRQPFLNKVTAVLEKRYAARSDTNYHLYGVLLEAQGQPEAALRAWEKALYLAPDRADWRLGYAQLLYQTGRLDEALKAVKEVQAQAPHNVPAGELSKAIFEKMRERK
jgi:tetratricopeptide (TPR) repeat protein